LYGRPRAAPGDREALRNRAPADSHPFERVRAFIPPPETVSSHVLLRGPILGQVLTYTPGSGQEAQVPKVEQGATGAGVAGSVPRSTPSMWRARIGTKDLACTRCTTCEPKSVPGYKVWTLEGNATPLELELERVRGICAKVALENAAICSLIPKLRKDFASVKASAADAQIKCARDARETAERCILMRAELDRLRTIRLEGEDVMVESLVKPLLENLSQNLRLELESKISISDGSNRTSLADTVQHMRNEQKSFQDSFLASLQALQAQQDEQITKQKLHLERLTSRLKAFEGVAEEESKALASKLAAEKEERDELQNRVARLESRLAAQDQLIASQAEQLRVQAEQTPRLPGREMHDHVLGGDYYQPAFPREFYSRAHATQNIHRMGGGTNRFQQPPPEPVRVPMSFADDDEVFLDDVRCSSSLDDQHTPRAGAASQALKRHSPLGFAPVIIKPSPRALARSGELPPVGQLQQQLAAAQQQLADAVAAASTMASTHSPQPPPSPPVAAWPTTSASRSPPQRSFDDDDSQQGSAAGPARGGSRDDFGSSVGLARGDSGGRRGTSSASGLYPGRASDDHRPARTVVPIDEILALVSPEGRTSAAGGQGKTSSRPPSRSSRSQ
jgi:uncharacterized coiled-coil protein SlyX